MKELLTVATNKRTGAPYTIVRLNELPEGSVEVPGFDGYYASKQGHVYSFEAKTNLWRRCNEIQTINKSGLYYSDINIRSSYDSKKMTRCRLHRVIARVFLSDKFTIRYEKGSKIYINHIDGDTTNNSLANLEVGTASENILHARHILHKKFGKAEVGIKTVDIDSGEVVEVFDCIGDFMRKYNIDNPGTANAYLRSHLRFRNKFYIVYATESKGE